MAVDAWGNATAVWNQHDGVRVNVWSSRYTPGGGWGTTILIESPDGAGPLCPGGTAGNPRVAVDPQGNVTVWHQYDCEQYNIRGNRYTFDVGWGTPVFVETQAGDARDVEVAVDAQGNATAVWNQYDGVRVNIWANRYE